MSALLQPEGAAGPFLICGCVHMSAVPVEAEAGHWIDSLQLELEAVDARWGWGRLVRTLAQPGLELAVLVKRRVAEGQVTLCPPGVGGPQHWLEGGSCGPCANHPWEWAGQDVTYTEAEAGVCAASARVARMRAACDSVRLGWLRDCGGAS